MGMTVACKGPFIKDICSGQEYMELPDFAEKIIGLVKYGHRGE